MGVLHLNWLHWCEQYTRIAENTSHSVETAFVWICKTATASLCTHGTSKEVTAWRIHSSTSVLADAHVCVRLSIVLCLNWYTLSKNPLTIFGVFVHFIRFACTTFVIVRLHRPHTYIGLKTKHICVQTPLKTAEANKIFKPTSKLTNNQIDICLLLCNCYSSLLQAIEMRTSIWNAIVSVEAIQLSAIIIISVHPPNNNRWSIQPKRSHTLFPCYSFRIVFYSPLHTHKQNAQKTKQIKMGNIVDILKYTQCNGMLWNAWRNRNGFTRTRSVCERVLACSFVYFACAESFCRQSWLLFSHSFAWK